MLLCICCCIVIVITILLFRIRFYRIWGFKSSNFSFPQITKVAARKIVYLKNDIPKKTVDTTLQLFGWCWKCFISPFFLVDSWLCKKKWKYWKSYQRKWNNKEWSSNYKYGMRLECFGFSQVSLILWSFCFEIYFFLWRFM